MSRPSFVEGENGLVKKLALEQSPNKPKNFEVMDQIYNSMRAKMNDSIQRVEPIIKKQANQLYYNKKVDLHALMKEKKKIEKINVDELLLKTQVYQSQSQHLEKEIKQICKDYGIDLKFKKLPFREKIRQIFNDLTAFHKYKRAQREMLDFSLIKNQEFIMQQRQEYKEFVIFVKTKHLAGQIELTEEEKKIYEQMQARMNSTIDSQDIHPDDKKSQMYLHFSKKEKEYASQKSSSPNVKNYQYVKNSEIFAENGLSSEKDLQRNDIEKQEMPNQSLDGTIHEETIIEIENVPEPQQEQSRNKLPKINNTVRLKKMILNGNKTFISDIASGNKPQNFSLATIQDYGRNERLETIHHANQSVDLTSRTKITTSRNLMNTTLRDQVRHRQHKSFIDQGSLSIFNSNRMSPRPSQSNKDQIGLKQTQKDILLSLMQGSTNLNQTTANFNIQNSRNMKRLSPIRATQEFSQGEMPSISTDKRREKMNVSFKMKTPKIEDSEIQYLIKNYPTSRFKETDEKMIELQRERQKRIMQTIKGVVEKSEKEVREERQKLLCDLITQNIREDQYIKTMDTLKEIDFAESTSLQAIYEYKVRDELDQIEQANEVVKEFHSGKLDPLNAMKQEKKRRATMNKIRGKI